MLVSLLPPSFPLLPFHFILLLNPTPLPPTVFQPNTSFPCLPTQDFFPVPCSSYILSPCYPSSHHTLSVLFASLSLHYLVMGIFGDHPGGFRVEDYDVCIRAWLDDALLRIKVKYLGSIGTGHGYKSTGIHDSVVL